MTISSNCRFCDSPNTTVLNTYKHHAVVCNDCNCVFHAKKAWYISELFIPRVFAKYVLPKKAFLRLFSDRGDFQAEDFYDPSSFDSTTNTTWRTSESNQVRDQLKLAEFDVRGKRLLDLSGGPGYVAKSLTDDGARVTVTEFSPATVNRMRDVFGLNACTFDYNADRLPKKFDKEFDLIMIRSSIIFCSDLDRFVCDLRSVLNENGSVLIESILPSYGEIFWWQQLEYKFPFIYSQEALEKTFYRHGFTLRYGYRDRGDYSGVKWRSYDTVARHLFTWLIEFPLLIFYRLLNIHKCAAIDGSMKHKMITQFWTLQESQPTNYVDYRQGKRYRSKTFGYTYNGYLGSGLVTHQKGVP